MRSVVAEDAGVVHQHVEPAGLHLDLGHESLDLGGVADVGRDQVDGRIQPAELRRVGLGVLAVLAAIVEVVEDTGGPGPGEPFEDGGPDPAGATGDQGRLAGEVVSDHGLSPGRNSDNQRTCQLSYSPSPLRRGGWGERSRRPPAASRPSPPRPPSPKRGGGGKQCPTPRTL